MTFAVDIEKFCQKAEKNADRFVRTFCQDLGEAVVENTPVKTGFLRNSWGATLNAPDTLPAAGGSDPLAKIALNLNGAKAGDTVFYNNNAKYGPFVEFGTSRMAPRAFVRSVVARAATIAETALRKVTKNG